MRHMFWHRKAIKLHHLNVPICISRCCMHLQIRNTRGIFFPTLCVSQTTMQNTITGTRRNSLENAMNDRDKANKTERRRISGKKIYMYSRKIGFSMAINFAEEIWTCHKNEIRSCYQRNSFALPSSLHTFRCLYMSTVFFFHSIFDQLTNQCHISNENVLCRHQNISVIRWGNEYTIHSFCGRFIAVEWKSSISIENWNAAD